MPTRVSTIVPSRVCRFEFCFVNKTEEQGCVLWRQRTTIPVELPQNYPF